jgi:hypothetical protein
MNSKIKKLYVVERESDKTMGMMIVLSRERLLVYQTASGLIVLPVNVVSNRWRIFGV